MINLEEEQAPFRTQGSHRPGMGTGPVAGPQISGQAFAENATDGGARTQFVEAVTGDTSGVSAQKRKNYMLLLGGLLVVGVLGAVALGVVVMKLSGDGGAEAAVPQPTIVAPTPTEVAEAPSIEFKVFSEPTGAALLIDGAEKGSTPAKFRLTEDKLPLEVELVLEGHEPRKINLEKGGQTTFDLKLSPVAKVEEPKPEEVEEVEEKVEEKPAPKPTTSKPKQTSKPVQKFKPKPKPKPADKKPVIDIWD